MEKTEPPVLTPGRYFRGLLIHSPLGKGAFGCAYLASHPVLRVPLVIKTYATGMGDDLFAEAHLAARVSSPNTVAVIDAGVEDGIPFVVQSYIDGVDLREVLA